MARKMYPVKAKSPMAASIPEHRAGQARGGASGSPGP